MKNSFIEKVPIWFFVVMLACMIVACDDSSSASSDEQTDKQTSSSSVKKVSSSSKGSKSSSSEETVDSSSGSSSSSLAIFCKTEKEDNCEYGELIDDRDCQVYKTVKIDGRWWMAENLRYETELSVCYNDSAEYCEKYGRLYPLNRIECPVGWHLPSREEWLALIEATGGKLNNNETGKILKSTEGWISNKETPLNSLGFSALPAGYYGNKFHELGEKAYFWTSTEYWPDSSMKSKGWSTDLGYDVRLDEGNEADIWSANKYSYKSARCVEDSVPAVPLFSDKKECLETVYCTDSIPVPCKTDSTDTCKYGSVTDEYSGQVYKTVKIGCQWWMAENMNQASYDDYSVCYNDSSSNCDQYGSLQPFFRSHCPEDYHMPNDEDYEALFAVIGGRSVAGKMLKSTSGWDVLEDGDFSGNGIDAFGFSLKPAGYQPVYDKIGSYDNLGRVSMLWSGPDDSQSINYYYIFENGWDYVERYTGRESHKYSVRCMKRIQLRKE